MKVGVIGYGYWGPKLVRNLSETPGCEMVWAADRSEAALERLRAQYPTVRTTSQVEDLLASDVDAVVVATPVRTHHALARAALLAGKHVMVEKPLTASAAEAEDLVRLAERAGKTLMAGHTFVYNAAVRALRDIVASGEIGEVYYVDAARLNLGLFQTDINVIWDLAPHDVSILLHVLQQEPVAVSARGSSSITPGVEDVAYVELRFANDLLAHLHLSWLDPCKVRRVTIVGSKKMVVCDDVEDVDKIRIYDKGVDRRYETDQFRDFRLTYRNGGVTMPSIAFREPLREQCEHFIECARTGARSRTDGRAGLRVVQVLEGAQRSLRNGGAREVIPPADVVGSEPLDAALGAAVEKGARGNGVNGVGNNGRGGAAGAEGRTSERETVIVGSLNGH